MKKQYLLFGSLLLLLFSCGDRLSNSGGMQQVTYAHPIAFAPAQYVCYRTSGALTIDGRLDEADWVAAPWTQDFVDIEGRLKPLPPLRTRAKMLWDDQFFYVAAELEEPNLWARLRQRDTVIYHDDDFEIFIDPDGDGLYYGEFEMNALNTVWDLLLLYPYRIMYRPSYINSWDIAGLKSAVWLQGTLNDPSDQDAGWTLEVALPWEVLRELTPDRRLPRSGEQWRLGFSRVDWHLEVVDGIYEKAKDGEGRPRPEENWVWSPQGYVDMHRPETWGFVQFTGSVVGRGEVAFAANPDEQVRWALWQLFHQQRVFWEKNGRYGADIEAFTIPDPGLEGYRFTPYLEAAGSLFEFRAPTVDEEGLWHINQVGRIWRD